MPAPIKMLASGDRRAIERMRVWTATAISGNRLPWLEQSRAFLGDPGCFGVRVRAGQLPEFAVAADGRDPGELDHLLLFPEAFCLHACRGRNYFQVCHILGRAGFMQRRRGGLYCELVRLPVVGRTSVYRIAGALMNEARPTQ